MTGIDLDRINAECGRLREAYMSQERPGSSARGLHHVTLLASDVERTVHFYQ